MRKQSWFHLGVPSSRFWNFSLALALTLTLTFAWGLFPASVTAALAQTSLSPPKPAAQPQQKAQAAAAKSAATSAKNGAGSAEADVTTAGFGDWQLSCRMVAAGTDQKPQRICEVLQSVVLQGQTAPFAQLGFGRVEAGGPLYFTAVVPVNVTFPDAVKIAMDEEDKQPLELAWTRCLPGGCYASVQVGNDVLGRWRERDQGGRLLFKTGNGQNVSLPISLKGLGRALDALSREKI